MAYLAELRGALSRGWDAFFFTPADPTPLGLIRLSVGLLALWSVGVYGLDLHGYLGSHSWADPAEVRRGWAMDSPHAWSFWLLVPDTLLRPVWVACLVVLALFAAGLWSRVTAVLAWVIVVSTMRRAPLSLFGFDMVLSGWMLYLAAAGASGQAVSLDRFFARWRQARAAVARRRQDGRWVVPAGAPRRRCRPTSRSGSSRCTSFLSMPSRAWPSSAARAGGAGRRSGGCSPRRNSTSST